MNATSRPPSQDTPTCKVCKKPVKSDDIVYRRFRQDGGSDTWHELCAPWHQKTQSQQDQTLGETK